MNGKSKRSSGHPKLPTTSFNHLDLGSASLFPRMNSRKDLNVNHNHARLTLESYSREWHFMDHFNMAVVKIFSTSRIHNDKET